MYIYNLNLRFCSVACQPPSSEEGGMVALSQMPTFLAVGQKNVYGDIVRPSEVICEKGGILVITRDEKTAPPINEPLKRGTV